MLASIVLLFKFTFCIVLLLKFVVPFVIAEFACNAVISLLAVVNAVLIIVELSRNPWVSLSTPAIGNVLSIVLEIILLAMCCSSKSIYDSL